MATDTMTSPLSIASQIIPKADQAVINGAPHSEEPVDEGDDRSSSLSELGERAGHDEPDHDLGEVSEANDTEAETERLEDSPQKIRKHQNVILTPANDFYEDRRSPLTSNDWPAIPREHVPPSDVDRMQPTSEISSPGDSDQEIEKPLSPTSSSPWKRKRSNFEQESASDRDSPKEPSAKATKLYMNTSAGALVEDQYPGGSVGEDDQAVEVDSALLPVTEVEPKNSLELVQPVHKYQKGKRKGRKIDDGGLDTVNIEDSIARSPAEHADNQDLMSSEEEEDENDEEGDAPDADNALKTEEGVIQKKTALDSLNAMEKCFATLRDKLFNERLAQCNEELAMLESSTPTHPELLTMKDAIDQRRDQKLQYEHTLLKFKMQTLQRESIANKAQAHSQYMQTVREIRDSHLEKLNKDFFQIQREKHVVDSNVADYIFTYPTERSQQITQQTAYNKEVSILSGIAKHVGFPAAPGISKARPKEIEDDLRSMGVPQASQNQPPILRAASSFSRQRSGPDERFLEQNPWANPQHPSHHQPRQQLHRQISVLSRAATPSTTPAAQRRVVDLTEPQGSASTIPEHPSGPNSSVAATPTTAKGPKAEKANQPYPVKSKVDSTPSRVSSGPLQTASSNLALFEANTDNNKQSQTTKREHIHSPSIQRTTSQDTHTPASLPKPLPFLHTGTSSSTPAPRTSTPGRYTVIKAEDPNHGARHSSMPRYQTPPVSIVGNGLTNRF